MRLDRHCSYGLHVQGWALTFERKRGCWPQWSVYRAGGSGSKRINNTLGHQRGDAVLKETAGRLRARVRASDTLARCGGDEFCIILSEVAREEDCARIVNNLRVAVAASTDDDYAITCSIGYALFPQEAADSVTLVTLADLRMYDDKRGSLSEPDQFALTLVNEPAI
jgi:GGDEF domain-containing protein